MGVAACLVPGSVAADTDSSGAFLAALQECKRVSPESCEALRTFSEEPRKNRRSLFLSLESTEDMELRAKLATALGYVGGEGVREGLVQVYETNISAGVRHAAIEALGRLRDPNTLPFLEKVLRSGSVADRIAVCNSLGISRLESAIPALIEAMGHFHPKVKASAIDAVGTIGVVSPQTTTLVLNILGNMTLPWTVHERALFTADRLNVHEATPLVVGFLNHPRDEVVNRACRTLGKFNTPYAVPHLLELVRGNEKQGGTAALALVKAAGKQVTNDLNWAAMSPDLDLPSRRQYFRALALRKSSQSVRPLAALLRSQDLQLVLLSLESLGQLGHPGAGAAIRPMLEHHSDEVRALAEWSMEQVSGLRHGDRLDLWDEWLASEASRGKPEPATPPTK